MVNKKHKNKKQRRQEVVQKVRTTAKAVRKQINIPNLLTVGRMWAIPAIIATFFLQGAFWSWVGVVIFILAAITDYLDGYLARSLNQLSRFGRVLDPIADKLLVGAVLIMMAWQGKLAGIMVLPAVIILSREILVSGLREFLAEIKVGCPVTRLAKWKTACQMMAIPMLLVADKACSGPFSGLFTWVGSVAFWIAAGLTVITGYQYWQSGRKYMNE